jgi:hypothetical protein
MKGVAWVQKIKSALSGMENRADFNGLNRIIS